MGDATKVVSKLNMPKVVAYGKKKGCRYLVVCQPACFAEADARIVPAVAQMGHCGSEVRICAVCKSPLATWLHDMVRLAAENNLMMNIHDEFRPSGFSRTYPKSADTGRYPGERRVSGCYTQYHSSVYAYD